MQIPKRKSEQNKKTDTDNFLSRKRIQELQEELEHLEKHTRPKVVEELTVAREMGDLSENAAYTQAKGRLMGIDRRIFEINEKLKNAIVIERGVGNDGTIAIGCNVTVRVNGHDKTYEITGSDETDPTTGRISYKSPVGAALLKHRAGDTVIVSINGKDVEYEIISVE
jgi:transcription elongation factor GreA